VIAATLLAPPWFAQATARFLAATLTFAPPANRQLNYIGLAVDQDDFS
jgi:hypothetical protein